MFRAIRLWEKKRGHRRTGSKLIGSLGEVVFFGVLLVVGTTALAVLLSTRFVETAGSGGAWTFWLMILVAVSFVLMGGVSLVYSVLNAGASAERRSALVRRAGEINPLVEKSTEFDLYPNVPQDANLTNSPGITLAYRLPVVGSTGSKLLAATLFCLVWNGIVAVVFVMVLGNFRAGHPDWLLTVFVVPFVGVGIWSIYYFLRYLLIYTGIGPTSVEISDHPLSPGGHYELAVCQFGQLSVNSLEVLLACDEESIYQQGTNVRTESCRVYEKSVLRCMGLEIEQGRNFEKLCQLQLPENMMHSFRSDHNSVLWKLVVKGTVPNWSDFERSFPVTVLPEPNVVPAHPVAGTSS